MKYSTSFIWRLFKLVYMLTCLPDSNLWMLLVLVSNIECTASESWNCSKLLKFEWKYEINYEFWVSNFSDTLLKFSLCLSLKLMAMENSRYILEHIQVMKYFGNTFDKGIKVKLNNRIICPKKVPSIALIWTYTLESFLNFQRTYVIKEVFFHV